MIGRFTWSCSLILALSFPVLSSVAAGAEPETRSSASAIASGTAGTLPESAPESPAEKSGNAVGPRNLVTLLGRSEITVQAGSGGAFSESMSRHQVFVEEPFVATLETGLQEAVLAGRSFSRDSHAARERSSQARAQTGQALAFLLPSVAVRASRGYETSEPSVELDEETGEPIPSDTHIRTDLSLTVRQPLFDLPGFLDWRRRKVMEQAREENYRIADGDAYVAAVNAYLALVSSRLQAELTRDFQAQLDDLLAYIEKRASAGAASVSDMARVRARSESTVSSRLEQESAHAAAAVEFMRLTNLVPDKVRLPVAENVGISLLPPSFASAADQAMQSNPDIVSLVAELDAAKIDVAAAKGRFLPRLDAEYTDTYSQHAGGDTDDEGQRDRRSMLVANWTLFNGGGDYRYHQERSARYRELLYRLDDQRRRIVQALSANYATLTTTRERLDSGYKELASMSTAAEAMSKRMLSGNQSLLDLLDVYDRYYQVRSRLVSLHILEMGTAAQIVRLTVGAPPQQP